jgi:Flp pilus assembly protein TadG
MNMKALTSFCRHRRAVAAMEFGLAVPFLALMFAGAADFGFAQWHRSAMSNAVAQGAYYAFRNGATVVPANVQSVVQTTPGVTVAVIRAASCFCPSGVTGASAATLGPAVTCASACTDGSTAGKYLTIPSSYTLTSFFPLHSKYNFFGAGDVITETVVVRLQ